MPNTPNPQPFAQDMKNKIGPTSNPILNSQIAEFEATRQQEQEVNNYLDRVKIEEIQASRDRDPLTAAIDERTNKLLEQSQNLGYIDKRDKDFIADQNPQAAHLAEVQRDVTYNQAMNDANISQLNTDKELQINQGEMDLIKQATDTSGYYSGVPGSKEETQRLYQLNQQMAMIQSIKEQSDFSSHMQQPEVMSTEDMMVNNQALAELYEKLGKQMPQNVKDSTMQYTNRQ